MPHAAPRVPRATYRVQLHAGFTFADAIEIVPYIARLGISHLYVSPVLTARPGSTHGYDVVDHGTVNEELGGESGFIQLTDALRAHGMGLVLDVVPNHMAIHDERNRWWWDVLEHGESSRYAGFFDIDWEPPERRRRHRILLPVLPDQYRRVLQSRAIRLARRDGRLVVEHGDLRFPIDPRTAAPLVRRAGERAASDELGGVGTALEDLPPTTAKDEAEVERRREDAAALVERLGALVADPMLGAALDAILEETNVDVDALDAILEAQPYRLASWRASTRDLGYRRFFDVDELIGLRVEDPSVFAETHRRVLAWVAEGRVQGLRIDHPDGLRDPAGYFERVRSAASDAWIVAEKILEGDEQLPDDWPIDGTTGYEFANRTTGLLVDPVGQAALDARWASVADAGPDWDDVARQARIGALVELLGSDVNRLLQLLVAVAEASRRHRDQTRHELAEALREVAAAMPVYRTYVRAGDGDVSAHDERWIGEAVACATRRRPDLDAELFAFLGSILRLEGEDAEADELAMRFQQLTPAAMAKGVEDTAFYRYGRLLALNEVGGDPGTFGTRADAFHAAMSDAAERWPNGMLALSTHDTKRSADVRARLAVLSEEADGWREAAEELTALAAPHRSGEMGPSDADVDFLLQTLVGAWPIDVDRVAAYMAKATREAKLHTSWIDPAPSYDAAVERLVRGALADPAFVAALERVVAPLVEPGRRAALAQVALHLTAPGVPDIYQGNELWELSLVDPDNRRPVDYARRRALLEQAGRLGAADAWARAEEGVPKLWLVARLLELRRRRPDPFAAGSYRPLPADGPRADAALAFSRGDELVTVVPRFSWRVARDGWGETTLALPEGEWRGIDERTHVGRVRIADLLDDFPVNVLERNR